MFLSLTVPSYWQSSLAVVDLEVLSLSFVLFLAGKQLEIQCIILEALVE